MRKLSRQLLSAAASDRSSYGDAPGAGVLGSGRGAAAGPLAGKIGVVSRITGVSPSTIRRRLKDDPESPKPSG